MNKTTWFVQTNMSASYWGSLKTACEEVGREFVGFTLIPFSHEIIGIEPKPPFVLMGSTTLHKIGVDSLQFKEGLFFDHANFQPSVYLEHHGSNMLNPDLKVLKIKDINQLDIDPELEVFIRSNDDSKQISGGTCPFKSLLEIGKNTEQFYLEGDLITPDSEVCIASVKPIYAEYRMVFIEGKLIASSQYRPTIEKEVGVDVKMFATQAAEKWTPNAVCVMDVAVTEVTGWGDVHQDTLKGFKIIEFNSFNGSGFYKCDLPSIIHNVSRYKETR